MIHWIDALLFALLGAALIGIVTHGLQWPT